MNLCYILSTGLSTGDTDLIRGKVPDLLELEYNQPCVLLSSSLSACKFPSMHYCLPSSVLDFQDRHSQLWTGCTVGQGLPGERFSVARTDVNHWRQEEGGT